MDTSLPVAREDRAKAVAAWIEALPLLPTVLLRVLHLDPEDDGYFHELAKLAGQEPNLAVRLLHYANSANRAPGKPVRSLHQAAMRIGSVECTHMVTALAVARVLVPRTPAQRRLWRHAVQVAHIARMVACHASRQRDAHDQSYVAGLLHDIGRFAMFEWAGYGLRRVDEAEWTSPHALMAIETELLGYDHAQLGAMVCERWKLPATLTEVVRLHHARTLPAEASEGALGEALRIVRLADAVATGVDTYPELMHQPPAVVKEALAPCVKQTELGANAMVLHHVAQHLQVTMRESHATFAQLMAG